MTHTIITATEFATLYGCSPQHVTNMLRGNTGILPMIEFKKSGWVWMITVPSEWVENKYNSSSI